VQPKASIIEKLIIVLFIVLIFDFLQCFDAVGWAAGTASGL